MSFVYRGLQAQMTRHIVTDEEVDRQIQRLQQQNPKIRLVEDRPTRLGDGVVLDYAGFCEGEQFAGGTAENQTLTLGSGAFIPGFEEQLVDKTVGQNVEVQVTFPENYHADNLAGKEAVFRCTIHQIREKSAYELDDTFAREVGRCDSFDQMRQRMRESLQAYTDERGEMDLQDRLLQQAAQTLEMTVTEEETERAVDQQMQTMQAQLAQQGLTVEMYCQFMNTTMDALREQFRPTAVQNIRMQAAVDAIVQAEGLQAEPKEIEEACDLICQRNQITRQQLQPYYDKEFEAAVVRSVLTGKVMDLIRQAAVITVTE